MAEFSLFEGVALWPMSDMADGGILESQFALLNADSVPIETESAATPTVVAAAIQPIGTQRPKLAEVLARSAPAEGRHHPVKAIDKVFSQVTATLAPNPALKIAHPKQRPRKTPNPPAESTATPQTEEIKSPVEAEKKPTNPFARVNRDATTSLELSKLVPAVMVNGHYDIATSDAIEPGPVDLRGRYGVSIITDRMTAGLLSCAQDTYTLRRVSGYNQIRGDGKPSKYHVPEIIASSTTGEKCPTMCNTESITYKYEKFESIMKTAGYTIIADIKLTAENDALSRISCPRGHIIVAYQSAIVAQKCLICRYEDIFKKTTPRVTNHASEYKSIVTNYRVKRNTLVGIPFKCPVGHQFLVTEAEVALGECPTCMLIREYAAVRQYIRVVSGTYSNPYCMLRCQCMECFAEFYISPQEISPGCAHRHKSMNARIANTAAIIRVLETLFNCRFDDFPLENLAQYDAYCSKYRLGIVDRDNKYTNYIVKHSKAPQCVRDEQLVCIVQLPTNASMRDIVLEVINVVGANIIGMNNLSAETKLQFASEFLTIMERLANANYDYPTREHVIDIVRRLHTNAVK